MRKFLCGALCAGLFTCAIWMTGCEARSAANMQPSSESASQSEPSSSEELAASSLPSSSESPSSEPEEEYPLPELSETDQKVLETDLIQFISFFGTEGTATASELDSQDVLFFCLVEAFRQKDMLGYYFEQNDSGEYLIPSSIVAQQAKNLCQLDGFAPPDPTRYDADNDAYRYSVGHDAGSYNYALADPKGTPDGGIAYEIDFFAPEDLNFEQPPLYTLRLSFSMARINGMPYLQFISKETI